MSCGGFRFTATHPEVDRWRETHPTDTPLTLMVIVSEYAMRLLIHKLLLVDKWEQMIWAPFKVSIILQTSFQSSPGGAQSVNRPPFDCFFSGHQTRFFLSRAVATATHWLADTVAKSTYCKWLWVCVSVNVGSHWLFGGRFCLGVVSLLICPLIPPYTPVTVTERDKSKLCNWLSFFCYFCYGKK